MSGCGFLRFVSFRRPCGGGGVVVVVVWCCDVACETDGRRDGTAAAVVAKRFNRLGFNGMHTTKMVSVLLPRSLSIVVLS